MIDEVNGKYKQNLQYKVTADHKYKTYHDKQPSAHHLKVNKFNKLNTKYDEQSSKPYFESFHWLGRCEMMKKPSMYSISFDK